MHIEALTWLARQARGEHFLSVVEFGARNVNGTARTVIPAERWIGVDLAPGQGVDVVTPAEHYESPPVHDLVVCAETLEHAPDVEGIVLAAAKALKSGGVLLVTCATDPRAPHSAVDGGALRNEHYANVEPQRLEVACRVAGLDVTQTVVSRERGDLYLRAAKP